MARLQVRSVPYNCKIKKLDTETNEIKSSDVLIWNIIITQTSIALRNGYLNTIPVIRIKTGDYFLRIGKKRQNFGTYWHISAENYFQ